MNKTEFLDLLRYYFRNAKTEDLNDILADYEAHFEEGAKAGLTEEEIAKEPGSPKAIYESFQSEGIVEEKEKTAPLSDNMKEMAGQAKDSAVKAAGIAKDAAGKTWEEVSPRLPGVLENTAFFTAKLFSTVCTVLAVVIAVAVLLFLGLVTLSVPPFPGMPHLPLLHPMTSIFLTVSGIFTALSVFLIGKEGRKAFQFLAVKAQGMPRNEMQDHEPAEGGESK